MDALPAVNRLPLCTPSSILGSGSHSPLPANRFPPRPVNHFAASGKGVPRLSERRVPGSSPGGSTGVSRYGDAALPSPQPTYVSSPASGGSASPHCPHRHHAHQAGPT
jgi:hypothetical protein